METGCYPKWLYHADRAAIVVKSKEEHDALGPGWVESPALVEVPARDPQPEHKPEHKARKRGEHKSGGKS